MAIIYKPGIVPRDYDATFLSTELLKIATMLETIEVPFIILIEQHVEPKKLFEGMVIKADGTNWNPGAGQGVYARVNGLWVKMS